MKKKRKFGRVGVLSLLLCLIFCLVMLPVSMFTAGAAESTESPAESTDPPAESTDAPAESTDAPAESTDAPAESTDAPAESTDPPAESTDSPAETTPIAPPSADDDDDDYYEPPIRVENELNQENISSDTAVWPNSSWEYKGVSTTTLSAKEVDALLKLAQKHEGDTDELDGDGLKEAIIVVEDKYSRSDNHTYRLKIQEKVFLELEEEDWDRLTVQTPIGNVGVYPEILELAAEKVEGSRSYVQMEAKILDHEGRPGLDVTLTVDGETMSQFDTTPYGIRIFIPYTPVEGEDVNALVAEYLPDDGEPVTIHECSYDAELGGLVLYVSHLSKFGVAYRPAAFADVGPDHWANPYVTFLVARGIISGDGDGLFRPDAPASRGEVAVMLSKALSAASIPSKPVQLYKDVPASSYLAGTSNWLYYNNLAGAITDGEYLRPNEAITREDMATLLDNIAQGVGLRLRSLGLDAGYTDADQIASYAKSAVTRLRTAGILEMAENYKFSPDATINRGEMAQIVATLLSSI